VVNRLDKFRYMVDNVFNNVFVDIFLCMYKKNDIITLKVRLH